MKVSDLTSPLLDYWVAKAETKWQRFTEVKIEPYKRICYVRRTAGLDTYSPSKTWFEGGIIIERMRIGIAPFIGADSSWWASGFGLGTEKGSTPLEAAMRIRVRQHFGEEVADAFEGD